MTSSLADLVDLTGQGYSYKFVGEGAANLVFEIIHPDGNEQMGVFQGMLLRVPKAGTQAYKHEDLQLYWETSVQPLFGLQDLVQQRLVRLGDAHVVSLLNAALDLHEAETGRRHDFKGSKVAHAEYGMLVEDMRKQHADDVVIEFKPKWLAQSPNAPPSAQRCRNCAREASRAIHNTHTHKSKSSPILCPLDFLACQDSPQALDRVVAHVVSHLSLPASSPQHTRLVSWLQTNELLARLRDAQTSNDAHGPLRASVHDPRFQLAMTLRDCTCFVRIPAQADRPVEAKFADLDMKNWEAKLGYWQATEKELIAEGYYHGHEKPRQRTNCRLEGLVTDDGEE
ncbi:inositol pentakisphosphate 2-kinase-like protein [Podospora appendiculata]|uniref:Inositol-pentakisphosphate 2-kinase n=1 Tax=Podospora appendiculata TaxID=314037 RepID=A0AAE1CFI7_9PEZI|nr:inositol pentakisphosphate 2-kinase-like protein [Podospora appendiculata]